MTDNCPKDKTHFKIVPGVTKLTVGAPGPETLDAARKVFAVAAAGRMGKTDGHELFQYGVEEGPTSYLFRLSGMLSKGYQEEVDMDRLFLTSGASAGLVLCLSMLLPQNGEAVAFIESPSYFLVLKMLKDQGIDHIHAVPMEKDGVDVEALERTIKEVAEKRGPGGTARRPDGRFWAVFYTVPIFHNPTGVCLSKSKSLRVVQIARKYDLMVICDDVYNLLHYDGNVCRRLVSYDKEDDPDFGGGHIISNGTFSKILGPGFRVGWLETSKSIIHKLIESGMVSSGGGANPIMAGILASAMEMGLEEDHIANLRETYGDRMRSVAEYLRSHLPEGFSCAYPGGGYFLWIEGPAHFDGPKFAAELLEKASVELLPGIKCSSADSDCGDPRVICKNCFRISIAYYEKDCLLDACQKICQLLKEDCSSKK